MKTILKLILITAILTSCEDTYEEDRTSTIIIENQEFKTTVPEFMYGEFIQTSDENHNRPEKKIKIEITSNWIKIGEEIYYPTQYYYSNCKIIIGNIQLVDFVRQLGMIHMYQK